MTLDSKASPPSRGKAGPERSKLRGYLTLFGGVCIHLFCGNLYLWGNISTYVVSYFNQVHGDPNATTEIAGIMLPLMILFQAFTVPLGAYMQKRYNPKLVLLLGSVIMVGSVFAATFCRTWWAFTFFYGLMFPVGIGIVYYVPIMCGWEWFPEHKGTVTGVVVAGYGFGAFIFGFISTALVNPTNEKPTLDGKFFRDDVSKNVPNMLRICLIFWALLCVVSIATVSRNPEYVQ